MNYIIVLKLQIMPPTYVSITTYICLFIDMAVFSIDTYF
jgi:hypothetical protein